MLRLTSPLVPLILLSGVASFGILCPCALAETAPAPAIYSAEQLVDPKLLPHGTLNTLLVSRDYRRTASVSNPGEFSASPDSTLIITRAFNSLTEQKLQLVPPLRIEVLNKTGEIRNRLGPPLTEFLLEPLSIQSQPELTYFRTLALSETRNLGAEASSVFTGLNPELQRCAQSSLGGKELALANKEKSALVVMDPTSGLFTAWWQSSVSEDLVNGTQFSRAGLLKPLILYAALSSLTPPSALTPVSSPGGAADDTLRLRDVVEDLDGPYYNDLAKQLESDTLLSVLKRVGAVKDDGSPVASLSPLQAARLLAFFSTLGKEVTPRAVVAVVTNDKVTRSKVSGAQSEKLDPSSTFLVNHLLGVPDPKTGALAAVDITTGASDGSATWFAAISPSRVTVLVSDRPKTELESRWKSYQSCAADISPTATWSRPPRLEEVQVDLNSGLRADSRCRGGDIVSELFLPGTAPTEYCVSQGAPPSTPTQSRAPTRRKRGFWRSLKDSATGIFR